MKAIVYKKYGPPEVAQLTHIAIPVPSKEEVLVKVHATTANRTDAGFRSAEYFVSRFWSGLLKPKLQILGCEFAGTIEAVGSEVTSFKKGDAVFGYNDISFGAHAEFLTIKAEAAITHMPSHFSFEEAAPLTEGAHYALNYIRASKVTSQQNVLVYGATGAIGSAAVQLLKVFGANVYAVCNTKNVALVKSLGADVVIDYEQTDFTKTNQRFHLIFDAVGKSSFQQCKPLLTQQGIYISTEPGRYMENVFYALFSSFSKGKKVLFPIPTIHKADVIFLKELAEKGMFKPVIDRKFTLEEMAAAYKYVESGQKTGNVVIRVVT